MGLNGKGDSGDRRTDSKYLGNLVHRIRWLVRKGEGREVMGSVPGLSHPVSLTTHPAFPAHALVSALRNLPLDSDQESQEARLPERGTELPVAHWHPQRWDPGLRTGAWEESRARSWGLLGSSRLLVPGGGRLSATDVSSQHRNPVGVWARDFLTQTPGSLGAGR